MSEEKTYTYPCTIEFEDVDSYGIAHHSKLINLLERARVHFFHDRGVSVSDGAFQLVLVNMDISFKSPAKMMDEVEVLLRIKKLSNFSLIWDYTIQHKERVILKANVKQASVGKDMKPTIFPEPILKALNELK